MTSTHLAIGIAIGVALTLSSWFVFVRITRPKKLSLRDYYDTYYNHCRNCEKAE